MKHTRMSVLGALIRKHGWTRGAELGLWQGALYGYLLDTFPRLAMIGVDNWKGDGLYAGKNMAHAEGLVRKIDTRHAWRSQLLKMSTVEAARQVPDRTLDFVFIDASHDTESVLADIRAWRPKLKAGGMLTGHDANWPTVSDALDEELPGWKLEEANVWTFG